MSLPPDTDISVYTAEMKEEDELHIADYERESWAIKHMKYLQARQEAKVRSGAAEREAMRLASGLHTKRAYAPLGALPDHVSGNLPTACPICTRPFDFFHVRRRMAFNPETGQFISWLCPACSDWGYVTGFAAQQFKSST